MTADELSVHLLSLQRLSVSTGDLGLRIGPKSALGLAYRVWG